MAGRRWRQPSHRSRLRQRMPARPPSSREPGEVALRNRPSLVRRSKARAHQIRALGYCSRRRRKSSPTVIWLSLRTTSRGCHVAPVAAPIRDCTSRASAEEQGSSRRGCQPRGSPLSTPSTGRSSASISLEYAFLRMRGSQTSHVVARSGDPQISSAGPRPAAGSDQLCAVCRGQEPPRSEPRRHTAPEPRRPRRPGKSAWRQRCSCQEQSRILATVHAGRGATGHTLLDHAFM
jgi:hypothetical protein